jgi:hypothetical protein
VELGFLEAGGGTDAEYCALAVAVARQAEGLVWIDINPFVSAEATDH